MFFTYLLTTIAKAIRFYFLNLLSKEVKFASAYQPNRTIGEIVGCQIHYLLMLVKDWNKP
jgi:hypothetical protein